MLNRLAVAAAMAAVATTLTGCVASASAAEGRDRAPGDYVVASPAASSQQLALLRDGVTHDDYLAAFENFQTCMKSAGFALLRVDETTSPIAYGIPDDAVQGGVYQRCYPTEFQQIDEAWQIANSKN